jgi:hypothetical protein
MSIIDPRTVHCDSVEDLDYEDLILHPIFITSGLPPKTDDKDFYKRGMRKLHKC